MATQCGFDAARHDEFFITLDKQDKIGREGVARELREAGHDEVAVSKLFTLFPWPSDPSPAALERLAQIIPATAEAGEGLRTILITVEREAGGRFSVGFDPMLVRGMGYYTRPLFEAADGGYGSPPPGGGRGCRRGGRAGGPGG